MDAFEKKRLENFPQLINNCYMDHMASTLYSASQIEAIMNDLRSNLYSNPHSHSTSSRLTSEKIDYVRTKILRHFHTNHNEYQVVFTAGCTAALKLVAECFQFYSNDEKICSSEQKESGGLAYFVPSHTSVVGMREIVRSRGAPVWHFHETDILTESSSGDVTVSTSSTNKVKNLLVYPGMCNFAGRKYPLEWIQRAQNGKLFQDQPAGEWYVLLDASGLVGTNDLNLTNWNPDFITLSFYKIFGYPTGLGALLVHKRAAPLLKKDYFGGGTVEVVLPDGDFHQPRKSLSSRFEDGTLPYLDIISLIYGFETLSSFWSDMNQLSEHVFQLAQETVKRLKDLHYANDAPLVQIYNSTDYSDSKYQGGVVAFNLLADDGDCIGYSKVRRIAELGEIHLRTGCFCNIGACQHFLGLSNNDLLDNWKVGHVCGDNMDIIRGKPTGAVRVSFGYMSHISDVERLVQTFHGFFQVSSVSFTKLAPLNVSPPHSHLSNHKEVVSRTSSSVTVQQIERMSLRELTEHYSLSVNELTELADSILHHDKQESQLLCLALYPVKACGPLLTREWPVSQTGLLYDRSWIIVREDGKALCQKSEPKLCQIRPFIDLHLGMLILCSELSSQYNFIHKIPTTEVEPHLEKRLVKLCGGQVYVIDCGDEVADWLDDALNREGCRLWWQVSVRESPIESLNVPISLAAESQFLLLNIFSLQWLRENMSEEDRDIDTGELCMRFRPNLITALSKALVEEQISQMKVANELSIEMVEPCVRCSVICIDQESGKRYSQEPLRTLTRIRPKKTSFGMYCATMKDESGFTLKCPAAISYTVKNM